MTGEDQSPPLLNRDQIHQLVSNRLQHFRSLAWEDDISRNAIDDQPFNNLAPINKRPELLENFGAAKLSAEELKRYARNDSAPLPCAEDREGYSAAHDRMYWYSGLRDFLNIMEWVEKSELNVRRYFDFGCASGRVIRHFAAQSSVPEIWGSDLNARHIRWLCDFMPNRVIPFANHSLPQLPIADHFFDLISAFSVFTHIDTFETAWLAELKRVLVPGGLIYVTIHNEDTWQTLRNEKDNDDNRLLKSMRIAEPEIDLKLDNPLPRGRTVFRFTHLGPYRAQVFHSNEYVRSVWGRFFQIVDILPCRHVRQAVVVMR